MFTKDSRLLNNRLTVPLTSVSKAVGDVFKPTLNQLIKSLFANGEQGFFYDLNDLSTLYQDTAGTTPVTGAGKVVGLVLDKSKGLVLGPELVVNGTFDTDTAWAKNTGVTISGGVANINTAATAYAIAQSPSVPANRFYKVTYTVSSYTSGGIRCVVGGTSSLIRNQVGTYTEYVISAGSSTIQLASSGGFVGSVDNFYVKEIKGNHAYQTTSSMRPLLVASPQRLDFDTVDDKLITTLPAQLTGCTIIRSVPNIGTQILTGQTIPTPYNDSTDHCGLIVINRALTTAETAQIAQLFNKAAGV